MGLATHGYNSSLSSLAASQRSSDKQSSIGGTVDEAKNRELRRRRNLLILLVGHEIERIAVWNNPLNRISLQISESLKFKYENLPKIQKCTWRDYIATAWLISSKLAVQLTHRFPQGRLSKYLQELILAEPTRALEIPDALQFLVTEDTVRANIPELSIF